MFCREEHAIFVKFFGGGILPRGKKFDAAEKHFKKKEEDYQRKIKNLEAAIYQLQADMNRLAGENGRLLAENDSLKEWNERLLAYTELSHEDIRDVCEQDKKRYTSLASLAEMTEVLRNYF